MTRKFIIIEYNILSRGKISSSTQNISKILTLKKHIGIMRRLAIIIRRAILKDTKYLLYPRQ